MIINPIIPIWFMTIICLILVFLVLFNKPLKEKIFNKLNKEKTQRQKQLLRQYILNSVIKILIIVLLFIINLRFMIPNGDTTEINLDSNILFVIDKSISMRALDYNENKERIEGVVDDCCYIIDELSGCKFSLITFGDNAQKIIPFTTDSDMVQSEIKSIQTENDFYAKGTSMNIVKDILEKTLRDESERKKGSESFVVFFITDGEITKEGEKLDSFESVSHYISNGAVLGYGTTTGGKMINSMYSDNPSSEYYYKYYYNENYKKTTALSKLDEKNLKNLANDLGIEYIQMDKQSNIKSKIKNIKEQIENSKTVEQKTKSYSDIYYYFAIPLVILLMINFIIQKRRI